MKYIYKTTQIFLLLSIGTIFIKKWTIIGTPLKINDIFLMISIILMVILIIKKYINLKPEIIKLIKYIIVLIIALLVGTTTSFIIFNNLPLKDIVLSYSRILGCCLIFIEIIIFTNEDQKFIKNITISLLSSLVVIPITYLFPQLISNGTMLDSSHFRFAGLFNDPNYYANFMIFPTFIILYYFLKEKVILYKFFLFIIFSLSLGFLVWTGSRSGWLGMISASGLFIIFEYKLKGFKQTTIISFFILIALLFGIFLTPKIAQTQIKERIHIFISSEENNIFILGKQNIIPNITITKGQDRISIWKQSIIKIKNNPLGYGPGYNYIINIEEVGGNHSVAQNTILQIILTGGITIFIYFLFIFKKYFFKFKENIKNNYIIISAIAGTLVSSLFIDSLESRWIWVYMAIYISLNLLPKRSDSSLVKEVL